MIQSYRVCKVTYIWNHHRNYLYVFKSNFQFKFLIQIIFQRYVSNFNFTFSISNFILATFSHYLRCSLNFEKWKTALASCGFFSVTILIIKDENISFYHPYQHKNLLTFLPNACRCCNWLIGSIIKGKNCLLKLEVVWSNHVRIWHIFSHFFKVYFNILSH